jgi:glutathione synthase/RimK-type ligase-like ATP-grasp enzyme
MNKIAIHHKTNGGFSQRWIAYCEKQDIPYKIVDCYQNNIINQLEDCSALMWHFHQSSVKDTLFAKQLLFSIYQSGKAVFPDFNTAWHFDDKVGQKYLLESLGIDLVTSYVFYSKSDALNWIENTSFPKVFKLRGGAGSSNVRLAKTKEQAKMLTKQAFSRGFKQYDAWSNLKERWRKYSVGKTNIKDVVKGVLRLLHVPDFSKVKGNERGYIYFQDFIPDNDHDIRVVVIDGKAFAIKRMTRENDFRASGSGYINYERELFDPNLIKFSFDLANKAKVQCVAIDYVFDKEIPKVVEISYGVSIEGYDACPGYWDKDMHWHDGPFDACGWMVDQMLA